jgi:2-polyprenyl-3-methyl-5-hydroxy-6-metoxy-1,4-benzoquinol methylase
MTDSSITIKDYKENPQKEIDMVQRLYHRFETEGVVIPIEQRAIYEKLASMMTGQIILDAGCGTGVGTQILGREARFMWGIDSNPTNIEYAKQMFASRTIKFDVLDLTNPPNRERSKFHSIVCIDVIEHIDDYQKALDTLKSFFRPGITKLWISTPNREHEKLQKDTPKNEFHVREWSVSEFYDILIKNFKYITLYDTDLNTIDLDSKTFIVLAKCEEPIAVTEEVKK